MAIEDIYGLSFGLLVLILVTIVTVVVIWQGLASWRAIKLASREDAYRKLADGLSETVGKLREGQEAISRDLSDVRDRCARMEHMLRQVE